MYHLDPNFVPVWAKQFKVGQGILLVDGQEFTYHVLDRRLVELPNFMGFPQGEFLFISEEVPSVYRDLALRHEVRETIADPQAEKRCRLFTASDGRCPLYSELEWLELSDEVLRNRETSLNPIEYARWRLKFYSELINFHNLPGQFATEEQLYDWATSRVFWAERALYH